MSSIVKKTRPRYERLDTFAMHNFEQIHLAVDEPHGLTGRRLRADLIGALEVAAAGGPCQGLE